MEHITKFFNAYIDFFGSLAGGSLGWAIITTGIGYILLFTIIIFIFRPLFKFIFDKLRISNIILPKSVIIIFILLLILFWYWVTY